MENAFISDGGQYCRYDDLAAYCSAVSTVFETRRVDPHACVALYADNTLPAALGILSLLARGTGFALCARGKPVPDFCRYVVHCQRTTGSDAGLLPAALGRSLTVDENPAWRGTRLDYRGRFYARTSGTTAEAKTAMFTHEKLWANARNCVERFQLSAADRVLIPVPVPHMYGLGAAFLPAILAGAAIEIQADSNVLRYLQREAEFQPTVVCLTPAFCYALTRLPQACRRYRLTVAAGDRTPPDTFERYERAHGCLVSLYGSTELGAVAAGSPEDGVVLRRDSVGRPMPGVRIVQSEDGAGAERCVSELCIEHSAGGEGYADARGEVDATDDRFAGGRLRSRDVGAVGSDGYVRVAGRSDHLVKRDGVLVSFGDVECALLKNEHVEEAVVLSDGDTPRGARLTAVCVLRSSAADPRTIREDSRMHLPPYAVPDRVVVVRTIPRLDSGKRDRAAVSRQLADACEETR